MNKQNIIINFSKSVARGNETVVVHNGEFHADDVCSVALLEVFFQRELNVIRTRDLSSIGDNCLVVDVGEGEFDHHGPAKVRNGEWAPGVQNCGLTLVASALQEAFGFIIGENLYNELTSIAMMDNGVKITGTSYTRFVNLMNGLWDEDYNLQDRRFRDAVNMVKPILKRLIEADDAEVKARNIVNALPIDKEVVVLPCPGLPWQTRLASPTSKALFVVFEDDANHSWYVQCVPPEPSSFEQRLPLPKEWLDKDKAPEGMVFCHMNRFICGFNTKDQALKEINEVVEMHNRHG